ncbi:glycosyltransferase family 2 protein, partial [Escherichia coli]|nr:glycosyltransferase family 2 protein [Escherichia coli]
NRSFFSKHFIWHVKSVFRFMFAKNGLIRNKSNICH